MTYEKTDISNFIFLLVSSFIVAVLTSWLPLAMANVIINTFNLSITLSWHEVTFVEWFGIAIWWIVTD